MEEFHRICANHTNHQKSYYETNSALKFFRPFFLSFHQNTFLFHHPHKFTIQTKSSYFSFTYWSRLKQQQKQASENFSELNSIIWIISNSFRLSKIDSHWITFYSIIWKNPTITETKKLREMLVLLISITFDHTA